jgi:hypothetical protein
MKSYTSPTFFLDTANCEDILNVWSKLKFATNKSSLRGVTTNPSALSKINAKSLDDIRTAVSDISATLYNITGHNDTEIHLQIPNTDLSPRLFFKWLDFINELEVANGNVFVVKIPPSLTILQMISEFTTADDLELNINPLRSFNVTGLTDASACLSCLTFNSVKYVSIIPGRMDENKLNSNSHLEFLASRQLHNDKHVIAGSMRTIDGLKTSIRYKTIPTIGTKLWNIMTDKDFEAFESYWQEPVGLPKVLYPPLTTEAHIELSSQFFKQMNELGMPTYESLRNA